MKKQIAFFILCVCTFMYTSCSNDFESSNSAQNVESEQVSIQNSINGLTKIDIPNDIDSVAVYNWADNSYLGTVLAKDGHIWIGSTNACMTVKLYNASSNQVISRASIDDMPLGYIKDATVYKSGDNVISIQKAENAKSGFSGDDFLKIFPAGKDNRNITAPEGITNFQHNVLYVSNGLPFCVYPIYSCGWYDLTLGIFYYDTEGKKHEVSFWDMLTINWKPSFEYLNSHNVKNSLVYTISKTSNAEGYQITLPENYVYGFYITSPQGGKFYCYSEENTCKEEHSTNLVKDNINYLAFEDQDNGDWDINDLICYVEPKQKVIDNPTEAKKDSVIEITPEPIVIPETVDKVVHGQDTINNIDVEARYDGKGHDYVRISKPLNNGEEIEIDLSNLNQYCQADDFRIVSKDDIEVIYCPNSSTCDKTINGSYIVAKNNCTDSQYNIISVSVTGNEENGVYQLKVALYPKDEESFNKVVEYIENCEWEKMFTIKKK